MMNILLVAIGGAFGSVCRYLTGIAVSRLLGMSFPWGTMVVNLVGSFAIGFLIELIARRFSASMELRLLLVVGVLGGFTTFSSFTLDALTLMERGTTGWAAFYVLATVILGLLAGYGGLAVGRSLL